MKQDKLKKKFEETQEKLNEIEAQMSVESRLGDLNRARSISVGTCFGGTTEIVLRGIGDRYLWSPMQPVEVIELIHQLAANVGCHIALKPREDFSSWREWKTPEIEKNNLNSFPPFANDMSVFQQLGSSSFDQKQANEIINRLITSKAEELVSNESSQENKKFTYRRGGRGGGTVKDSDNNTEFSQGESLDGDGYFVGSKRTGDINGNPVATKKSKNGRKSQ